MIPKQDTLSSVAIVGRGRLGSALLDALRRSSVESRLLSSREQKLLVGDASLVLLAVADGAIREVAERLASSFQETSRQLIALHHSGVLDSSVLDALERRGFATGSCHPLQTFPDHTPRAEAFRGVTFALEGSSEGVRAGRDLATRLGGRAQEIRPEQKPLYHMAASMAANGLVGLLGASRDALVACGFSEHDALSALSPLTTAALTGCLSGRPEEALSGPVSRGDSATLHLHRLALSGWSPDRTALYEALVAEQVRLVTARQRKS